MTTAVDIMALVRGSDTEAGLSAQLKLLFEDFNDRDINRMVMGIMCER